ncbi:MAG: ribonuclease Z [Polyangiaceae bacterium]|nr:ribonuclease Z [Polyangiaceae bacterium]
MTSFSVRIVGVGDAFTTRYFNACLLIEAEGTRVLIDAPPALARALGDLGERGGERVGLDDIDHVVVTHLHGDHVGGLEQLLFWRRFVTGRKAALYAIPEVLAGLWETRLKGGMEILMNERFESQTLTLEDYADVLPLGPGGTAIGPLLVDFRRTLHHIPTSALRIRGRASSFAYSADTAFDPALIAWLGEADLFFHETNLGIHTPLASLAALPETTRRKMRLIHYPDFHSVEESPIECAREGQRYDLG